MSLLGVILARGGSKRLPGKNIRDLGGKPLIAWTIEAALKSVSIDKLVVSTDSEDIAEIAESFGAEVPFLRPASLSTDSTSSVEALLDMVTQIPGYEDVMLLQPTSPFRTHGQIDSAYSLYKSALASNLVSVRALHEAPSWLLKQEANGFLTRLFNESAEKIYAFNGAIYIANTKKFLEDKELFSAKTLPFVMDSSSSIDIDTEEDFRLAEFHLKIS